MAEDKYIFVEPENQIEDEDFKSIDLLPDFLKSTENKKFFDTALDTLLSQDKSETIAGYIGNKDGKIFRYNTDFYIPEKTKNRQNYQLSPTVVVQNNTSVINQMYYDDIVNKLRYQGANTLNHSRMFDNEYYSFAPHIDIDKFLNFNQYYWVTEGPLTIELRLNSTFVDIVSSTVFVENIQALTGVRVRLVGNNLPLPLVENNDYYLIVLDNERVQIAETQNDANNGNFVVFQPSPPSEIEFQFYTRLKSDIEGRTGAKLPDGTLLQNGMKIKTFYDEFPNYQNKDLRVEGVSENIEFYDETNFDFGEFENKDYVTIHRNCNDRNSWARRNRWFHNEVLRGQGVNFDNQGKRPIVEFDKNIQLLNFGNISRDDVDLVFDEGNIQNITGQSSYTIDNVLVEDDMRILVINDNESDRTGRIYRVFGLAADNSLSLNLELDGNDLNGSPSNGEVVFVKNGDNYGGEYLHYDNEWLIGQKRIDRSQNPIFELYDYEGFKLSDESVYPGSDYDGCRLFGYDIDENSPIDDETGRKIVRNEFNDVVFRNYIEHKDYTYLVDFQRENILGFYFFNKNGEFLNHWNKAEEFSKQFIVDEEILNPKITDSGVAEFKQIYELSQIPDEDISGIKNIEVRLGSRLLEKDVDYIFSDKDGNSKIGNTKYISLSLSVLNALQNGDLLKIRSYSSNTPDNIKGYYEIPKNLSNNAAGGTINKIGTNELVRHFSTILEGQSNFSGNAFGNNNTRNINVEYNRGENILQHTASMKRLMGINSFNDLDVMDALRYNEYEYRKFYRKLSNKITQLNNQGLDENTSYTVWINTVLEELNIGKTDDFPFYNSGVANRQFIPPSPSYLGITPTYRPIKYIDRTLQNPRKLIRFHDGHLIPSFENGNDVISEQIINTPGGQFNFVLNESVVFAWEILVEINQNVLIPEIDYTIVGGNTIQFFSDLAGSITIEYSSNIIDKVLLAFENEVYNSIVDSNKSESIDIFNRLEVVPGYYRNSDYSRQEFNNLLKINFNRWVTDNNIDLRNNIVFDYSNEWTFNYSSLINDKGENLPGSWRGIFFYYYDTDRPHLAPWEMLGFSEKPEWWTTEYGNAPYTKSNITMWNDIENGIIKNGPRKGEYDYLKRDGLSNIIPVDDQGNILTPLQIGIINKLPSIQNARKIFEFGDLGPLEFEWKISTYYPHASSQSLYLAKPARYIDYFWDTENYTRLFPEQENNQLVYSDVRKRIPINDFDIFSNTIFKIGVQQIFVDFLKSKGKNNSDLVNAVQNSSIKLGYRVGGFIDSVTARFNADNFGLVPNENFKVNLYKSASKKEYTYSSLVFIRTEQGYEVSGYDINTKTIPIYRPLANSKSNALNFGGRQANVNEWNENVIYDVGTYVRYEGTNYRCITRHRSSGNFFNDINNWAKVQNVPTTGGISVRKFFEFNDEIEYIDYNTEITNAQEIFDIIQGYNEHLIREGWIFDQITTDGNTKDFVWAANSLFNWVNSQPNVDEILILSPFDEEAKLKTNQGYIDNMTQMVNGSWPIIGVLGAPLKENDYEVSRFKQEFSVKINTDLIEDRIHLLRLSSKEIEHSITFDNETNFSDLIYDDVLGVRQRRLKAFITRSGDWNGTLRASGFIISNDNIVSNIDKNIDDFRKYYDSENLVIGGDFDKAAKKLIGFNSRDYFRNLLFDTRDSFQFYQGFLREKGTERAFQKMLRNEYVQTIANLQIQEEWALRIGSYGALSAYSSIDLNILRSDLRSNPQIIQFIPDDEEDDPRNSIIELSTEDERYIFKRPNNLGENQFNVTYQKPKLPNAGYLILSDAQHKLVNIDNISSESNNLNISEYDRLWVAIDRFKEWNVYRFVENIEPMVELVDDNGVFKLEIDNASSLIVNVDDYIYLNDKDNSVVVKVVEINANILTIETTDDTELNALVYTDETFYLLEKIRFNDLDSFFNYNEQKSWTANDLVFIDNDENNRWVILNPDNSTSGNLDVYRKQEKQIDSSNILNSFIYDFDRNINLIDLIPYHPIQNVLPVSVKRNLDFILGYDPAYYNSPEAEGSSNYNPEIAWKTEKVGKIWWDLRTVRYLDYDQSDNNYRLNHWGAIFPGTSIDIYQWVKSPFPPNRFEEYKNSTIGKMQFSENAEPKDMASYVLTREYNVKRASFVNVYYFWVKNNDFIPRDMKEVFKNRSTNDLKNELLRPTMSGLPWITPLTEDSFVISNIESFLTDSSTIKINFLNYNTDNLIHNEWVIVSEIDETRQPPKAFIKKLKDSLVGFDEVIDTEENLKENGYSQTIINNNGTELENGNIRLVLPVPDDNIISISKYGNLTRPRQSWFTDREMARANFRFVVNNLLIQRNWFDDASDWEQYLFDEETAPTDTDFIVSNLFERDNLIGTQGFFSGLTVLVESDITLDGKWSVWEFNGETFDKTKEQSYRASDFWEYKNYFNDPNNENIIPDYTFDNINNRNDAISQFNVGDVIRVDDNGVGLFEIYEYDIDDGNPIFNILEKENGTFALKENITIPNIESCRALRVIYEGIMDKFTNILSTNTILIAMVREAFKQNNLVDWAFKTSLVNVVGFEELLEQKPIFEPDRTENVIEYLKEVKPYHVKLREFLERKTSTGDTLNANFKDEHDFEIEFKIDRVSCVGDMNLPESQWTAAERITNLGGNPEDVIPGCRFRGTEVDGKFFKFFENITGVGYDMEPYDSSILGYDYTEQDIESLYDMIVNGRDFTSSGLGDSDVILDGGNFIQPLLSDNRPPELINTRLGDNLNLEVLTLPFNANLQFGYDTQGFDNYVDEDGDPVGYDYIPSQELLGTMPIITQDLFEYDGNNVFPISQEIPQSNDAIYVYINGEIQPEANYNINWEKFRPEVQITSTLNTGDLIKILSFTAGGKAGRRFKQIYEYNITTNVFDFGVTINASDFIYVLINGEKDTAEWTLSGASGLSDSEFRVPNAVNGDTVYAILFDDTNYAEMFTEVFTYSSSPLVVSNPSRSILPDEIHTIIYKDGYRLNPPYIRYFDPVTSTNTFNFPEPIRNIDFVRVFLSNNEQSSGTMTYNEYDNSIQTSFNVNDPQFVSFLNDINSDFHFDGSNLHIHTVAFGNNPVTEVEHNMNITIDSTLNTITRPDATGNIPLAENGNWNIDGDNLATGALNLSGTLTINSNSVTVETTDDRDDIVTKINNLQLPIQASIVSDVFTLSGIGVNFVLSGDWNILGITNGNYYNVVKIIQDNMGNGYRINQLSSRIKIIRRDGNQIDLSSSSSTNLVTLFGLSASYNNTGSRIKVITMDENTLADMRTETFQGVTSGQYAITKNGFNSYSTVVSVLGQDNMYQSDFQFGEVTDSTYDENIYNYEGNPGILFGDSHNEYETVVITTYNGLPTTFPRAFRIFKTLQNKFYFANIDETKTTRLVQPLRPTDDEIIVRDATILSQPQKSTNTPGSVFIEGELIQYFEIDTSVANEHKLSQLIRGAKGTAFGYVNERIYTGNDLTDEYVKVGTNVVDFANSIHNVDYNDVRWGTFT